VTPHQFNSLLRVLGLTALVVGALLYLVWRAQAPWLLSGLDYGLKHAVKKPDFMQSLPSGLHAFGFTCLLGACWGGSRWALAAAGLLWFLANSLWEWACHSSFPWPALRVRFVGWLLLNPGLPHECTYDKNDIIFAGIGAVVPSLLQFILIARCTRVSNAGRGVKK